MYVANAAECESEGLACETRLLVRVTGGRGREGEGEGRGREREINFTDVTIIFEKHCFVLERCQYYFAKCRRCNACMYEKHRLQICQMHV